MTRKHFDPREVYPRVRDAVLSGATTIIEISKMVGVPRGTLGGRIRDDLGLLSSDISLIPTAVDAWLDANRGQDEPTPITFERPAADPKDFQETIRNEDGSIILRRVLAIAEEDQKSPERVLELCGYDPDIWKIKYVRQTLWTGQRGQKIGGGQEPLIAVELKIEPKMLGPISLKDAIEVFIERLSNVKPAPKIALPKWERSDYAAEAVITDTHFIAQPHEGPPNTLDAFAPAFGEIAKDIADMRPKHILLPIMGDICHIDTMKSTTTAGTQLEIAGTPQECIDESLSFLLWASGLLAEIAPLDIIIVGGNHDRLLLYALGLALQQHFLNSKHVTVDNGKALRKIRLIGPNLVGFMHGELSKTRDKNWLPDEFPEEWGKAEYREIHAGDKHTHLIDEAGGIWLRNHPSPAIADYYTYKNAYSGRGRAFMAHRWNLKRAGEPMSWSVPVG